jgi:hypothetical protein
LLDRPKFLQEFLEFVFFGADVESLLG